MTGLSDVSETVKRALDAMTKRPDLLSELLRFFPLYATLNASCLEIPLTILKLANEADKEKGITPTADSSTTTSSTRATASYGTPGDPYYISDWERTNYYHGISSHPPELLYRSNLLSNPFPKPIGRNVKLPTKTIGGVFNTPLNAIWDTAAPQIISILKAKNIRYTSISTVRFTSDDGVQCIRSPPVIWITIPPDTATAKDLYELSPEILTYLQANGVEDVVVEWIEGVIVRL